MKVTNKNLAVIGLAIFIIAFVGLYLLYSKHTGTQDELDGNIALSRAATAKVIADKTNLDKQAADLKAKLAQLESALSNSNRKIADIKASLPESLGSIEFNEEFFQLAKDTGIVLSSIITEGPSIVIEQDVKLSAMTFNLTVSGEVVDILNFVYAVINAGNFAYARISTADVTAPPPPSLELTPSATPTESPTPEPSPTVAPEQEKPQAALTITVYGQGE